MNQDPEAPPRAAAWTRVEDYLLTLARQRTAHRTRQPGPRTQVSEPRLLLSTLPFIGLIGALGVLAAAIAVAALPSGRSSRAAPQEQHHPQPGVAAPGWFERAKREMR